MEEIYGPDPVQVPAGGLWTMPAAVGFAVAQMIRGGLLDADLHTIGWCIAARRRDLAKDKSAIKGGASVEADCCRKQQTCSHSPQP